MTYLKEEWWFHTWKGVTVTSSFFVYFQFIAKGLQLITPGIVICRLYYLYSVKANLVKYSNDLKYWRLYQLYKDKSSRTYPSTHSRLHWSPYLLFFKIFFDVDYFLVFITFVTILLLFCVLFCFGCKACRILSPWPGIKPAPAALEGEVLTTWPTGKSILAFLQTHRPQSISGPLSQLIPLPDMLFPQLLAGLPYLLQDLAHMLPDYHSKLQYPPLHFLFSPLCFIIVINFYFIIIVFTLAVILVYIL